MEALVVCVERNEHGDWVIIAPGQGDFVTCESIEDARNIAYLHAARHRPCQLVVRDADHRVLSRETIGSPSDAAA